MPEDAFDIPVPNTVGEFVELLRQYPPNLPLEIRHRDDDQLQVLDLCFDSGALKIMLWRKANQTKGESK